MSDHQDALETLNRHAPLSEKLKTLHDVIAKRFEFIDRSKLDPDCVEALIKNRAQLEEIRDRFQESSFPWSR